MRFSVTTMTAVLACLGMATAYVGVLYTLPRSIRRLPRDHPTHNAKSARGIALTNDALIAMQWKATRRKKERGSVAAAGRRAAAANHGDALLGVAARERAATAERVEAVPLERTLVCGKELGALLLGHARPVAVAAQLHPGACDGAKHNAISIHVMHLTSGIADRVRQGPLTEEFVFRSCMIPLLVCADFSVKQIVWGSPLTFGVAHLHHFMEHLRNGRSPKDAGVIVLFQLFYTSLFGAYASFMYLRTGHFVSIFVVHVFCNIMGFPDISFFNPENSLHPFRIMILGAYFVGIYGFTRVLGPWTDPAIYSSELWNATTSFREPEFEFGGY